MTTPAASRAATLPALPDPVMGDGEELEEPIVQGDYYTAEQMRAYALAALEAAQPASPAPLTDDGNDSFTPWSLQFFKDNGRAPTGRDAWRARAALASPQVAPHPAYLEARDAILHDRGPLEGEGLTSEQTNAVLAVLDDAFAAPVQVAPDTMSDERIRRLAHFQCGGINTTWSFSDERLIAFGRAVSALAARVQVNPARAAEEVPAWKADLIRSATPYCIGCEKEGHRTDKCWSTTGFNTPRDMEMARLTWRVDVPEPTQGEQA